MHSRVGRGGGRATLAPVGHGGQGLKRHTHLKCVRGKCGGQGANTKDNTSLSPPGVPHLGQQGIRQRGSDGRVQRLEGGRCPRKGHEAGVTLGALQQALWGGGQGSAEC